MPIRRGSPLRAAVSAVAVAVAFTPALPTFVPSILFRGPFLTVDLCRPLFMRPRPRHLDPSFPVVGVNIVNPSTPESTKNFKSVMSLSMKFFNALTTPTPTRLHLLPWLSSAKSSRPSLLWHLPSSNRIFRQMPPTQ